MGQSETNALRTFFTRAVIDHRFLLMLALTVATGTACLSFADPLLVTGDEVAHLDYAVTIWNGKLPNFYDGLGFRPPVPTTPPVQWVSQHPPLFYLLSAPAVGPAANSHSWILATVLGRMVNVVIASALVPASAWMSRAVLPSASRAAVATSTTVIVLSSPVFLLGSAFYNDLLAFLIVILLVGTSAEAARSGATRRHVVMLSALGIAAVSTRVMTTPFVLAGAGMAAASTATAGGWRLAGIRKAALQAVTILVVSIGGSAWFYARNVQIFGSITGGDPDWAAENLGRHTKPVSAILTDVNFWKTYATLASPRQAPVSTSLVLALTIVLLAAFALAMIPLVRRLISRKADSTDLLLGAMFLWLILTTIAIQVIHRSGGGGVNWRYSLPLLIPVALVVALGIDRLDRGSRLAIIVLLAALSWWSPLPRSADRYFANPELFTAPIPTWLMVLMIVTCLVASIGVGVSLVRLWSVRSANRPDGATPIFGG